MFDIIISVLAIINIYYWLVTGIASVCLVPCAKLMGSHSETLDMNINSHVKH